MTSKLLRLFLFMFVAFVGISAMLIAVYAYARQDPGHQIIDTLGSTPISVQGFEVKQGNRMAGPKAAANPMRFATQKTGKSEAQLQLEKLEAQRKVEANNAASFSKPNPEQVALQQRIEQAEQDALRAASSLLNADSKDEQSKRSARLKLQKVVQEAFDLRIQLQNSQLDDAEAKLKASRQRLIRRQSLAKQIVERRVNELLNTDETKWAEQSLDVAKPVSPLRNQDQTTSRPGPRNRAATQSPSLVQQKIPNAQSIRWELSSLAAAEKQAVKQRETALAERNVPASLLAELEYSSLTAHKRLLQHQLEQVEIRNPIDGLSSDLESRTTDQSCFTKCSNSSEKSTATGRPAAQSGTGGRVECFCASPF